MFFAHLFANGKVFDRHSRGFIALTHARGKFPIALLFGLCLRFAALNEMYREDRNNDQY